MKAGFYMVLESGDMHFISSGVSVYCLESVANKYLNEQNNWKYWIAYCYGFDVKGNIAWANCDQSDRFI